MEWIQTHFSEDTNLLKASSFDDIHEQIILQQWRILKDGIQTKRKLKMLTEKAEVVGRKRKTNNIDLTESKIYNNNQNNQIRI